MKPLRAGANVFLFLTLVIGCSQTEKSTIETEKKNIDAVYAKMSLAYKTYDIKLIEEIYTAEAFNIYAAGKDTVKYGLKNFINGFKRTFDYHRERETGLNMKFKFLERRIDKTMAYDIGYFKIDKVDKQGVKTPGIPGKFVTVLLKQPDGSWKFQVDIYGDATESAFKD